MWISPFFARQKKRIFLFFLWGDPVQNRPQNPAPAGCLFSTRKSRSEVPERGDCGEENCPGRVGRKEQKKEKGMHKKRWGIQEGFTAEPPRNDSGANFQGNDSGFGPKVRVTGRKVELQTESLSCSRGDPQKPN